jgi:hypothetical protein
MHIEGREWREIPTIYGPLFGFWPYFFFGLSSAEETHKIRLLVLLAV